MRYEIPQFIDVEDKIFGPLSLSQFMYVAGGIGIGYLLMKFIGGVFGVILALPFLILAFSLAFLKYNGRPFISTLEAYTRYLFQEKAYLWKRRTVAPELPNVAKVREQQETLRRNPPKTETTPGRLEDLSWSLDIYEPEKGTPQEPLTGSLQ